MGVKELIVAINKIDEKNFEEIKQRVSDYLKKIEYNPKKINFVPIASSEGINLMETSN